MKEEGAGEDEGEAEVGGGGRGDALLAARLAEGRCRGIGEGVPLSRISPTSSTSRGKSLGRDSNQSLMTTMTIFFYYY